MPGIVKTEKACPLSGKKTGQPSAENGAWLRICFSSPGIHAWAPEFLFSSPGIHAWENGIAQ